MIQVFEDPAKIVGSYRHLLLELGSSDALFPLAEGSLERLIEFPTVFDFRGIEEGLSCEVEKDESGDVEAEDRRERA